MEHTYNFIFSVSKYIAKIYITKRKKETKNGELKQCLFL